MKALIYRGVGQIAAEDRPKPELRAVGDAIVKVRKTTICGTDLHILKGDVPSCEPGRVLGHEGIGVVDQVGSGVTTFKPGDPVMISCISACGKCEYCRRGMYSHCTTGGWLLGNAINGTQTEYLRAPHADVSLYRIPDGVDEDAMVILSDILPAGFECGTLNGKVAPGSTVAIIGAGPVGLAALLTAQFYSPAEIMIADRHGCRLEVARRLVDAVTAPLLIRSVEAKKVDPTQLISHHFPFDRIIDAYETFSHAADTHALRSLSS